MAISEYFKKEIFFALIMTLIFRQINEEYRKLFMGPLVYISLDDSDDPVPIITETNGMYDFTN